MFSTSSCVCLEVADGSIEVIGCKEILFITFYLLFLSVFCCQYIVRRARPRVVPPLAILPAQELIQEAPLILEAMAEKTLREFSVPSTNTVATGPNINVGDMNFELKSSLINMVQASPFYGKPNEDANAHMLNFLELCDTVVIWGVAADVVKLRLFPFSLLGKAK